MFGLFETTFSTINYFDKTFIPSSERTRCLEVLIECEEELRDNPYLHHAWYQQGCALLSLGRLEEAIDSFECATTLHPEPQYASGRDMCAYYLSVNDEAKYNHFDMSERFLRYSIEFGGIESPLPDRYALRFGPCEFLKILETDLSKESVRQVLVKPRASYFLRTLLAEPHKQEDWSDIFQSLNDLFAQYGYSACLAETLQRATISLLENAGASVYAADWLAAWKALPNKGAEVTAAVEALEAALPFC